MSDELQILTTNAASDGWVDGVPGAVSTGYQAQNTVLQALFNGLDKSSVRISGANLIVDPSGVIDDSGLPFVVSTLITLAVPSAQKLNFLKVVAGSTALERSIEFTDDRGTYDAAKNGFYNISGERILNWVVVYPSLEVFRLGDNLSSDELLIGNHVIVTKSTSQSISDNNDIVTFNTVVKDRIGEWVVNDNYFYCQENNFINCIFTATFSSGTSSNMNITINDGTNNLASVTSGDTTDGITLRAFAAIRLDIAESLVFKAVSYGASRNIISANVEVIGIQRLF
jgi:hypothetical protein